jgi:hypothetical protein
VAGEPEEIHLREKSGPYSEVLSNDEATIEAVQEDIKITNCSSDFAYLGILSYSQIHVGIFLHECRFELHFRLE